MEGATVRSCSDVHNFLQEQGVAHEMLHLPASSRTAQAAASLLGVPVARVVKSLVFLAAGEPRMVLVPGDSMVDTRALCAALGGAPVELADARTVYQLTGFRVGAVPPCAVASDLPVVADPGVFAGDVVYCGGGTTMTMLKIRSADLRLLLEPLVVPVARPAQGRHAPDGR